MENGFILMILFAVIMLMIAGFYLIIEKASKKRAEKFASKMRGDLNND